MLINEHLFLNDYVITLLKQAEEKRRFWSLQPMTVIVRIIGNRLIYLENISVQLQCWWVFLGDMGR